MKNQPRFIIGVALALLFSCSALAAAQRGATQGPTQSPAPGGAQNAAPAPPAQSPAIVSPNYIIGPNDKLRIVIVNQDEASGDYVVQGDGSFTFAFIGQVVASGRTVAELEKVLRERLVPGIYRNPQIIISVTDFRSKRVHVWGAVARSGTQPITGEMGIIEVLVAAGGTTADAGDDVIVVRPQNAQGVPILPGQDKTAIETRFDLRQLQAGQRPLADTILKDGDTVFVPPMDSIHVSGEVKNPGMIRVKQDTTVRQALSLAGGPSEFGALNRITIIRIENGQKRDIKDVKQEDLVKSGDTITVPRVRF